MLTTQETFINVPGGQIYLKKWMPEQDSGKAPLVLLHDSLGSVALWKGFPEQLTENLSRCVIAYDRLGFGKSDARKLLPSYDFIHEEATKYFPAIKQQLGLQEFALLGYSVGGAMAINIASEDPTCQAVVTISAQAFVEERTLQGVQEARRMFKQPGQIERLEKWHGLKAEWVLDAWTELWLAPEFKDWSLAPVIHDVRCPVLAIHGDNDEYGSMAFPEFIAEKTGGESRILILKECGHMPHKERAEEVVGVVSEFL